MRVRCEAIYGFETTWFLLKKLNLNRDGRKIPLPNILSSRDYQDPLGYLISTLITNI